MKLMAGALLVFEDDPTDDQLAVVLGPDFAANGVTYTESAAKIELGPPRIPTKWVTIFIAAFFGIFTAVPWVLPSLGVELPRHLARRDIILLTAAVWGLIIPTFLGLMYFIDHTAARLGPGAVVDRRKRTLWLPYADRTVALGEIHRFVDLAGRRNYGGRNERIIQYGVLFGEGEGIGYAPIAKLTGPEAAGSSLGRLAEACGVRVRRVRASEVIGG